MSVQHFKQCHFQQGPRSLVAFIKEARARLGPIQLQGRDGTWQITRVYARGTNNTDVKPPRVEVGWWVKEG